MYTVLVNKRDTSRVGGVAASLFLASSWCRWFRSIVYYHSYLSNEINRRYDSSSKEEKMGWLKWCLWIIIFFFLVLGLIQRDMNTCSIRRISYTFCLFDSTFQDENHFAFTALISSSIFVIWYPEKRKAKWSLERIWYMQRGYCSIWIHLISVNQKQAHISVQKWRWLFISKEAIN